MENDKNDDITKRYEIKSNHKKTKKKKIIQFASGYEEIRYC